MRRCRGSDAAVTSPRKPLLALRFGIGATSQSHCADRAIERAPVSSSILTNLHLREQNTYDILCGRGSPVGCRRAAVRLVRCYDATADGLPLIPQPRSPLGPPAQRGAEFPQGEKGSVARLKRRLYVRIIPLFDRFRTRNGRRQAPIRKYRTSLVAATFGAVSFSPGTRDRSTSVPSGPDHDTKSPC